jgi:hypothetical protein
MALRHAAAAIVQGFTSFLMLGVGRIDTAEKCKIHRIGTEGVALVMLYSVSIIFFKVTLGAVLSHLADFGARPLESTRFSFSVFSVGPWRL